MMPRSSENEAEAEAADGVAASAAPASPAAPRTGILRGGEALLKDPPAAAMPGRAQGTVGASPKGAAKCE